MLTNYYNYDQNKSVSAFLKEVNQKKNFNYVILDTSPKSLVDVRTLSLKSHNEDEKLKTLKRSIPSTSYEDKKEVLQFLINSGEQVIEYPKGYFDFIQGLKEIQKEKPNLLKTSLHEVAKPEVYALNEGDKIATAKHLFVEHKVNILPVINENLEVVGELRTKDLLSSNLFDTGNPTDLYSQDNDLSLFNTPIENLMYKKPVTLQTHHKIKDALDMMLSKSIPSIIITQNEKIYSVISYKDIFKYYNEETQEKQYNVEYVGFDKLYEDEKYFIKKVAERTAQKISKTSSYNELKIIFKTHGNHEEGHLKKGEITAQAIAGNKVISVNKEISPGTSDEETNDKKKEDWNIGKLTQQALRALEEKIQKQIHK